MTRKKAAESSILMPRFCKKTQKDGTLVQGTMLKMTCSKRHKQGKQLVLSRESEPAQIQR